MESAILFSAHVNDELINHNAWLVYLTKYIPKPPKVVKIETKKEWNEVEAFLQTRIVGHLEADMMLMGQ